MPNRFSLRVGVVLTAAAVLLAACKDEPPVRTEEIRPVRTAVATLSAPTRTLVYSGSVRSSQESALGFRVGGKILDRPVKLGDRVKAGALLARLDPQDLRLAEASARANVEAARSRRQMAEAAFVRAKTLFDKGWTAKAALDKAQLELDSAVSALDAAEASLRQSANQTGYAELRADAAGVVTATNAEPGQVVGAGQPVVTLARDDRLEVSIAVPEQEIGRVRMDQPVSVSLWAEPDRTIEGRVREIAAAADPASRTYAVRIAVRDPKGLMRLGMTASVEVEVPAAEPSVVIPVAALTRQDGQASVWVVDTAGATGAVAATVSKRHVTPVGLAAEGVRIREGLAPGERVVSAGVQFLREGLRVRVEPSAVTLAEQRS